MAFAKRHKTYIVTDMNGARNIPVQPRKRRSFAYWARLSAWAAAGLGALILTGFIVFFGLIYNEPSGYVRPADGIVVLTGGEARIPEAVKLLTQGKGRRLLISGVNPVTTRSELVSLMPDSRKWFRCCIDVGKVARDTIGNADETREWIRQRGFKSLIVVTASYHMPRSLAELRRALPDTVLIPYPVKPRNLHLDAWWAYPGTLQLLAFEYVKFVPAFGRCLFIQLRLNRGVFGGSRLCVNAEYAG
jgi:uncharacterized SAM-binding protein YcdF (DUF218 family)